MQRSTTFVASSLPRTLDDDVCLKQRVWMIFLVLPSSLQVHSRFCFSNSCDRQTDLCDSRRPPAITNPSLPTPNHSFIDTSTTTHNKRQWHPPLPHPAPPTHPARMKRRSSKLKRLLTKRATAPPAVHPTAVMARLTRRQPLPRRRAAIRRRRRR